MTKKGLEALKGAVKLSDFFKFYVTIGKDKNVKNDYSNEIEAECLKHNIPYHYRGEETANIKAPDYVIAIGWRWLIAEQSKLIVFHDSILPKYRGFNPLVTALINGDKEVGVTALFATSEYDKGNLIAIKKASIKYPIKIQYAIEVVSKLYLELITDVLQLMRSPKITAVPQNELDATYSLWRDEEDYLIDWDTNSEDVLRFINAVGFPYGGAKAFIGKDKVVIEEASVISDLNISNRQPGKVILIKDGKPVVVCRQGLIKIDKGYYNETGKSFLPLTSFRTRFKNNA